MKGGVRLRLDLDEGWCETLHYITIHQKRIDLDMELTMMKGGARLRLALDEGWCDPLHYITIHQKRIDLDMELTMMKGGTRLRLDLDEGWCDPLHYITIHQKRIDLDEGLVLRKTDADKSLKKDKKGSPLKKASLKKDSPSKKSQAGSRTDTLKKSSPHAKALKKDQELALVPVSEKRESSKRQSVMSLLIPMASQKSWPPLRSHHQGCGRRRGWEQWASTRHQSLCTKVWRQPWAWIRMAWKSQQQPWKRQLGHQRLSRRTPWKRNLKKRRPQRRHPWKRIGSHGPRFQRQHPEILPDVIWQAATTKMRRNFSLWRCPTSGPSSTVLWWIGSKKHWRRTTSLRRRPSKWEWTCVHSFFEKGHADMS